MKAFRIEFGCPDRTQPNGMFQDSVLFVREAEPEARAQFQVIQDKLFLVKGRTGMGSSPRVRWEHWKARLPQAPGIVPIRPRDITNAPSYDNPGKA